MATAQSSLLNSTSTDAPGAAYQSFAAPIEIAVDRASPQANTAAVEATAIPAPRLETDPIPPQPEEPTTSGAGADAAVAANGGPSLSSATAGFQPRSAQLTRQQMADRAMDDDGGRRGLGRDAVLMIIGGAAIVAGAIVGGSGGTALIVVGAIIGATGLILILS
jgi:hypothetical protein